MLWLPVMLGLGIAAWFVLPDGPRWIAVIVGGGAVACVGGVLWSGGRLPRVVAVAGLAVAMGCALAWWRAVDVAAPVLAGPAITTLTGEVERVETLPARDLVRLVLRVEQPAGDGTTPGCCLPPRIRVNLAEKDMPTGIAPGAVIRLRARLMPPASPAVPGAYDFARVAWFAQIGATGRGFAPVEVIRASEVVGGDLRARLSAHIQAQVGGSAGAIAATLATGDRGAIAPEDDEAMRRSGLAHLLSISGLHVTAMVGATMFVVLRLLALFPPLALRFRLPVVAGAAAALAAVGYTWLTGSEVPTIRSCIAALLVLAALAMGREAITLRLVAAGALIVLLLWPEALAGPSFQLSFAAVTAIVVLHESTRVRGWFGPRDEGWGFRLLRGLGSLLLTGIAVEAVLMPIGLYHFHKAGMYGAIANIIAIPLTTFVVMPVEALALILDLVGLGAPLWWVVGRSLDAMLWVAHLVASAPGAVAALPAMPNGAFALMVGGGLWAALWRTRVRVAGVVPFVAGALWALATPAPDLIVTGDGRHLAIRTADGGLALLRERAGDYTRSMLGEGGGVDGDLAMLDGQPGVACSPDLCVIDHQQSGRQDTGARRWRIIATRSGYLVPAGELIAACRTADIVVSERRLPNGCTPRWIKLDRAMLARTGGVAVTFAGGRVTTVRSGGRHPWVAPERVRPPREGGGSSGWGLDRGRAPTAGER